MARFSYQPITIENQKYSKPGQILIDNYTGDLYVNFNNIIKSITKIIAEKIEDLDQIDNDVLEQIDVILSLEVDFYNLLNIDYGDAYKEIIKTYADVKALIKRYNQFKKNYNGKSDLVYAIKRYMTKLEKANIYHKELYDDYRKRADDILQVDFANIVLNQQNVATTTLQNNIKAAGH